MVSILKITKPIGTKAGVARAWQDLLSPLVADTAMELEAMRSHLSAWHSSDFEPETRPLALSRQQGLSNGSNSSNRAHEYEDVDTRDDIYYPCVGKKVNDPNSVDLPSFLQASDIAWIHPPSYLPEMWDDISGNRHIYKHLFMDRTMVKEEKAEEEEASTSSKASYRGLSEGHLHLRRLLSAFNPQFASSLASTHIYMCLEEVARCSCDRQ